MKTPKYRVGDIVLFRGQNYSLSGDSRKVAVVVGAEQDVGTIVYDIFISADKDYARNCYEDMLDPQNVSAKFPTSEYKVGDEFEFGLSAEYGYENPVVGKIVAWSNDDPSFAIIAIPPGFDPKLVVSDDSSKYAKRIRPEDGWLVMGCDTDFLFRCT